MNPSYGAAKFFGLLLAVADGHQKLHELKPSFQYRLECLPLLYIQSILEEMIFVARTRRRPILRAFMLAVATAIGEELQRQD